MSDPIYIGNQLQLAYRYDLYPGSDTNETFLSSVQRQQLDTWCLNFLLTILYSGSGRLFCNQKILARKGKSKDQVGKINKNKCAEIMTKDGN